MSENTKYKFLHFSYWMMYCVCFGYSTVYLQNIGFSASEIGMVTALFCLLSAFLSLIFGKVADKSKILNWKRQIQIITIVNFILSIFLCFLKGKINRGIVFGVIIMLESAMMPLLNSASFYYEKKGKKVNFGQARGIGSLSFALSSLILGNAVDKYGSGFVPLYGIWSMVFLYLVTLTLPFSEEDVIKSDSEGIENKFNEKDELTVNANEKKEFLNKEAGKGKREIFIVKYPMFALMILACICMMITHNMENTYLIRIVEKAGGNSKTLGVALAMAACLESIVMIGYVYIVKKISSVRLLLIAGVCFILKSFLYLTSVNLIIFFIAQGMQIFTFAIFASASVYYTDEVIKKEDQVLGQAYMSSTIVIGTVVGNLIGGWAIDLWGIKVMLLIAIIFAALSAAIALIVNLKEKRLNNELPVS